MSRTVLDRRTVLRGLLGGAAVSFALPPLEAMMNTTGTAWASGDAFPTRFALFMWGNGMLPDRWVPPTTGAKWRPSDQLAPLADLVDQVSVVTGTRVGVPNLSPHFSGAVGFLTGAVMLDTNDPSTYPSPTIDQVVASVVGGETRFRSLEVGARAEGGLSFNGPFSRNPAEEDPLSLYRRLFGEGFTEPGEEPIIDPRWALRRSVLDAVREQSKRLETKLGYTDRVRLEEHMDHVRAIEQRLLRLEQDPPNLASCTRPTEPAASYPDVGGRPPLREKNAVFCELLAMACACDQVRVISNYVTKPVSDVLFPGAVGAHHQLTHDEPGGQPEVHAITIQCVEMYADMVRAFQAIPEGDATLLDHSVIMGSSEVSLGRLHSLDEFPLLLAGSASGRLKQGVHVRLPGVLTSRAQLTVLRAVGLSLPSWGTLDNTATDGLGELEP